MKKTKTYFKTVTIEEYYAKEKDGTYWYWRFAGTKEWNKVLTPFNDSPYIEINWFKVLSQKGKD